MARSAGIGKSFFHPAPQPIVDCSLFAIEGAHSRTHHFASRNITLDFTRASMLS
jgi:hypothetical protein